ncbi:MAG TPA: RIP metalloprotease RseP, partial [Pseudomonadales bacterium]|nr:RIP metalloprotease RseP [Pseudomonadales bacterium]
ECFVPDDQLHLAFNRKPVLQRMAIVAAGPLANFLLAIMAYWLIFTVGVTGIAPILGNISPTSTAGKAGLKGGQEIVAVDGVPTKTWSDVNMRLFERIGETGDITITAREPGAYTVTNDYLIPIDHWMSDVDQPYPASNLGLVLNYPHIPAVIGGLLDGEPAMKSGLSPGDEVVSVNGDKVSGWEAFVDKVQGSPNKPLDLAVKRKGQVVHLTVVPRIEVRDGSAVGYIGASRQPIKLPPAMQRKVSYPFYEAIVPAVKKTWSVTVFTLESIKKMLMGAISHKNLSGPITIAQIANASAQTGLESFIGFIALLSISLGVLNLLPIPVLDGGHLLYYFIEFVTGKPVPERIQVWGLQIGMFLIVSIMLLAFYNDLMRL